MLIVMMQNHTATELNQVVTQIQNMGYKANVLPGRNSTAVGITGNAKALNPDTFLALAGVQKAIPVTTPYKLAGRDFKPVGTSEVHVGPASFKAGQFVVIAGPCAIESEEQTLRIAHEVKARGAQILRGGAFKPRTSPYSFQGLGHEGLKILTKAREITGLPFVTEAVDLQSLEQIAECADMIQIGTRNMQNFALLQAAGRTKLPIMLKRGMSSTIEEWLMAAEYILDQGNDQIVLCERGVRSFDSATRNLLDLSAVVALRLQTHLPVIVDPSHGTGRKSMIAPMSFAAIAAGAHGIMVDVHDRPHEALCDGPQAICPGEFGSITQKLHKIHSVLGEEVAAYE